MCLRVLLQCGWVQYLLSVDHSSSSRVGPQHARSTQLVHRVRGQPTTALVAAAAATAATAANPTVATFSSIKTGLQWLVATIIAIVSSVRQTRRARGAIIYCLLFLFLLRTSSPGVEMSHQLPLRRDPDGQVYLDGTGPVSVQVDFHTVLGNGGQGAVFMGRIFDMGGALVKEVSYLSITHTSTRRHGKDWRIQRGPCLFLYDNCLDRRGLFFFDGRSSRRFCPTS